MVPTIHIDVEPGTFGFAEVVLHGHAFDKETGLDGVRLIGVVGEISFER